jgi:hypothetical protein
MVGFPRDTGRHVGVDKVSPAEVVDDMIKHGELTAGVPLSIGHARFGFLGRKLERG